MFAGFAFAGKMAKVLATMAFWQGSLFFQRVLHRLTYRPSPVQKTVLVIGASFAGYQCAVQLAGSLPGSHRVVVVESSSHLQVPWFFPRFSVVSGHEHKCFVPYGALLNREPKEAWSWIRGRVDKLNINADGGSAVLASGERVEFDYVVVATGASAPAPSRLGVDTKEEGIARLQAMQAKIKDAKNVVVLGGGPAGIEIAGDIKSAYAEKNVVLVHSRDQVLNDSFGPKLRQKTEMQLHTLGVELVLGERIRRSEEEDVEQEGVTLASGRHIPCDCFV
jgi:apoptosis-inducing factor 2